MLVDFKNDFESGFEVRFVKARKSAPGVRRLEVRGGDHVARAQRIDPAAAVEALELLAQHCLKGDAQFPAPGSDCAVEVNQSKLSLLVDMDASDKTRAIIAFNIRLDEAEIDSVQNDAIGRFFDDHFNDLKTVHPEIFEVRFDGNLVSSWHDRLRQAKRRFLTLAVLDRCLERIDHDFVFCAPGCEHPAQRNSPEVSLPFLQMLGVERKRRSTPNVTYARRSPRANQ